MSLDAWEESFGKAYSSTALQDVGLLLILVLLRVLICEGRFVKIISLYTLRTLCFSATHRDGQIDDEEGVHKKDLHRSLIVVACLWASLGFLVTINVAVDGVHRFYGPVGYCKPRPHC